MQLVGQSVLDLRAGAEAGGTAGAHGWLQEEGAPCCRARRGWPAWGWGRLLRQCMPHSDPKHHHDRPES